MSSKPDDFRIALKIQNSLAHSQDTQSSGLLAAIYTIHTSKVFLINSSYLSCMAIKNIQYLYTIYQQKKTTSQIISQ